jgi:PKHD-type hydroxylase
MLLHVPNVLSAEQVESCLAALQDADWQDGSATAGHQSVRVKNNVQLPQASQVAKALGDLVLRALEGNPLFISAALPRYVYPPLFNKYVGGMSFGAHVDNAIRPVPGTAHRVRTDVSCTLFLSDPNDYEGGELVVEDSFGAHSVKLPAGDMILYPASSLHRVTPVTRGARIASFFWTQSMVRDDGERSILFEMDNAIRGLSVAVPDSPDVVRLTSCYHNLLRRWADV